MKKKTTLLFIACGVLAIAIGFYIYTVDSSKTDAVSAHPTNSITLNPGEDTEYEVPKDSTSLVEPRLISQSPLYDAYVQAETNKQIVAIDNLNIYSDSDPTMMHNPIEPVMTDGGNYIVGIYTTNELNVRSGYTFVLLDNMGNVLDLYTSYTTDSSNRRVSGYLGRSGTDYIFSGAEGSTVKVLRLRVNDGTGTITSMSAASNATTLAANFLYPLGNANTTDYLIGGRIYFSSGITAASTLPVYKLNTSGNVETVKNVKMDLASSVGPYHSIQHLWTFSDGSMLTIDFSFNDATSNNAATLIDTSGNVIRTIRNQSGYSTSRTYVEGYSKFIPSLSDGDTVYCFEKNTSVSGSNSYLWRYTRSTDTFEIVKTYERDTVLLIQKDDAGVTTYFGWTPSMTGEFAGFQGGTNNIVVGTMDDDLTISTSSVLPVNNSVDFIGVTPIAGSDRVFITGRTLATNLVTAPFTGTGYINTTSLGYPFMGTMLLVNDYAPAIKADEDIIVDISDNDFLNAAETNSYGWTIADNWLITGSKNGSLSDASTINVFDRLDYEDEAIAETPLLRQQWLDLRINRNPNELSAAIDWAALGFDDTKTGPQQVTYFVVDSQKQVSSASRWANKITDQTVISDDGVGMLDAQNFAVPLASVGTDIPDVETFKQLAKTMAWDTVSHDVYEDGAAGNFDTGVTVDYDQLLALQNATEARPYPVDVSFRAPTAGDGDDGSDNGGSGLPGEPPGGGTTDPGQVGSAGQTITNRVWVFVTTKNTVVDIDTGIVIYGDDYTLPLYLAAAETADDVYRTGNIRVYDYYDHTHETDADCLMINGSPELPTLADKDNATALSIANMNVINEANEACIVQPELQYTAADGTITAGTIEVTITADVLFHVRQVIVSENNQLPLPEEGYIQMNNSVTNSMNLAVSSGLETGTAATEPDYKTFTASLDTADNNYTLVFEVILPEYYDYVGYAVSDTELPLHSSSALSGTSMYRYDLAADGYEKWLTLYIQPTSANPNQYSWDYKTNAFGMIAAE